MYNGAYRKPVQHHRVVYRGSKSNSIPYSESHPFEKEFPIRLELEITFTKTKRNQTECIARSFGIRPRCSVRKACQYPMFFDVVYQAVGKCYICAQLHRVSYLVICSCHGKIKTEKKKRQSHVAFKKNVVCGVAYNNVVDLEKRCSVFNNSLKMPHVLVYS